MSTYKQRQKSLEDLINALNNVIKSDKDPNSLLKEVCDPNFILTKPKMIIIDSLQREYESVTFDEKKVKL